MPFKRRKSKPRQVADLLASYLKLKAVSKAAKGAGKAAKGTAAYEVATRTPLVKRVPIVLGAGAVAVVAAKLIGGGNDESAAASA